MTAFRPLLALVALALAIPAARATATNPPSEAPATGVDVCKLLRPDALQPWGFGSAMRVQPAHQDLPKDKIGTPSDLSADICNLSSAEKDFTGAAFLVVESFAPGVSPEAVGEWLTKADKKAKASAKANDDKSTEVKVDGATCESGEYPTVLKEGEPPVTLHFVACDRQVGARHISMNFEWPGEGATLPSPAEVKTLLDTAIAGLPKP